MEQNGEREAGKTTLRDSPDFGQLTNDFDKNKVAACRRFRPICGQNASYAYQHLSRSKQNQNGPESDGKSLPALHTMMEHRMPNADIAPDGEPVVYFIGWKGLDVKIGFTRHLRDRLTEIIKRTGAPQRLLASTPGSFAMERAYHERFASARKHGEWFNWSPEIEAEIARLTGAPHGA